jgi:hypothetical protein
VPLCQNGGDGRHPEAAEAGLSFLVGGGRRTVPRSAQALQLPNSAQLLQLVCLRRRWLALSRRTTPGRRSNAGTFSFFPWPPRRHLFSRLWVFWPVEWPQVISPGAHGCLCPSGLDRNGRRELMNYLDAGGTGETEVLSSIQPPWIVFGSRAQAYSKGERDLGRAAPPDWSTGMYRHSGAVRTRG